MPNSRERRNRPPTNHEKPDGISHRRPFASTSNAAATALNDIRDTIEALALHGIKEIEIGFTDSCPDSIEEDLLRLQAIHECAFLVHNYFPPPRVPFVLNLAATDRSILDRSRALCKRAIDLSARLGAPFFSVHAGFCFEAEPSDLGREQFQLKRIDPADAEEIFVESLCVLREHARGRLLVIVENNVLDPRNLINGRNLLALGVDSEGLLRVLDKATPGGLGLLIDVGHLKVSAETLGFDREEFLRDVADKTTALHLSDNDGSRDTNGPISPDSWFWDATNRYLGAGTVDILEAHGLTFDEVVRQLAVISAKRVRRPTNGRGGDEGPD